MILDGVNEEIIQLRKLADLYKTTKILIIYCEEIDPTFSSNIQVFKELKDAYDHLMRAVINSLEENDPSYCRTHLDKAVGHTFRAAFDALDGTVISLREKISQILNEYPHEVVIHVLPSYWEERVKLDLLTERIGSHRNSKDVGGNIDETLNQYVQDTAELTNFYKKITDCGPSLDDCHSRHKKRDVKKMCAGIFTHTFAGVLYTIIIGVGGAFLHYLYMRFFKV